MSRTGIGRWLLALGWATTLLSVAYLIRYVMAHKAKMPALTEIDLAWATTAVSAYAAALAAMAWAWLFAMRAHGDETQANRLIGVCLLAQVGKYVPGNIAQHVGRVALATSQGAPVALVVNSTIIELASAVVAGLAVSAVTAIADSNSLAAVWSGLRPLEPSIYLAATVICAGISLLVAFGVLSRRIRGRMQSIYAGSAAPLFAMLVFHCLNVALAGFSFYAIIIAVTGRPVSILNAIFVFSVAWLAGFITPGAPAGLGIREFLLVVGLPQVGSAALAVAVTHRIVTAIADALMALVGASIFRREFSPRPPSDPNQGEVVQ